MADKPDSKEAQASGGSGVQAAGPARPAPKAGAPGRGSNGGTKPAGAKPAAADKPIRPAPAGQGAAAAAAAAAPAGAALAEELIERRGFDVWLHEAIRQTPSWLVSMVVHMIVLLVMALIWMPAPEGDDRGPLTVSNQEEENLDVLDELEDEPLEEIDVTADLTTPEAPVELEQVALSPADDMEAAAISVELSEFGLEHAPKNDLLATVGTWSGDALSGRGNRAGLVARYGGTPASEKAVAAALKWLAVHQMPDGGWSFDLSRVPTCRGQCRNSGKEAEARIAATGLALLPFLGAGQTHKTGKYKDTVKNGLYFLVSHMKATPNGGSLREKGGRMYSHGIASIALCEAYAMTRDRGLYNPAQAALKYICYAQDPVGGGWRYEPRQSGDTSVVGWQLMALKSGHMAYLQVPPLTIAQATKFLNSVQTNSGANYGYTGPGNGPATTAIGLLSRMYLGWKKDNPALQRGVAWLSQKGPSTGKANMYYNYYATQVMRHWEGDEWKKWNEKMRDFLVGSQATKGHEAGSWFFGGQWSDRGGRLYDTAMATMTLEVYYRHLPIYRTQSVEEDFPVE